MASPFEISAKQLSRLIGTPAMPCVLDVRLDDDITTDPTVVPGAQRLRHTDMEHAAATLQGQSVVVYCQRGLKLSQGVAARLRAQGIKADVLVGGHFQWRDDGYDLLPVSVCPAVAQTVLGRGPGSRWVTRQRPKIDRVACPWLIRRFIDPAAEFLFVPASDVMAVAERFDAEPFDVTGATLSHANGRCAFDALLEQTGFQNPALHCVADIVRAADLGQSDAVPEAAGVLAVSLGLSRLYRDDNQQLEAGLALYDALYRWARDARDEVHQETLV